MLDPVPKSPLLLRGAGNHIPSQIITLTDTLKPQLSLPPTTLTRTASADSPLRTVPLSGHAVQSTSFDRRASISLTSPSASPSLTVRIPVTPDATPLDPPDHSAAPRSNKQGVENELVSSLSLQSTPVEFEYRKTRAHLTKLQRTLGENVPTSLVFKNSNGITLRGQGVAGARSISDVLDVKNASHEEMKPVINNDRSAPVQRSLSPKQKLQQVKRALKMEQMFGELPPSSLYQSNASSMTFGADAGSDSDEGSPVPPPKDDFTSESETANLSDNPVWEDDEDIANGFGKIRSPPRDPSPNEESPVQSAYPYISTLSSTIPVSTIKDRPFRHYTSHSTLPIAPAQRSTSLRPARPLPKAPHSSHSFHTMPEDEGAPSLTHRRASTSGVDIARERRRSHSSHSCRGSHTTNLSIYSTISASTSISDDPSFQTRRKRATKLARFFGVNYNDLQTADTNPLTGEEPGRSSISTTNSSGSKVGLPGTQQGDESAPSVPLRPSPPIRYRTGSRPSTPYESSIENKSKEKPAKGVRIINPRDNPEDVGEVLARLRAMR